MAGIIFHIDVNSAYLSWSALKRLSTGDPLDLRTVPAIVGGDMQKRHGVVLAKSVPAKKYGIVTGEPIVNAFRKCPSLILEAPDQALYHRQSSLLMHFLSDICPDIEQLSIDECFMDFTPIRERYSSPEAAAKAIKDEIRERFGFTVNIGISDRKVLAKMASDFQKPDKVHTLYSHEIREKMWPLPVSSLYMCGHSSSQALLKLEIRTIGDLACADQKVIEAHLKSHGLLLFRYANGIDDSPVVSVSARAKGIGNSTTLAKDVTDRQDAFACLLSLCESVSARLRKAGQFAGMVSVEIKYSDFKCVSHQAVLSSPANTTQTIYEASCRLFDELWNHSPIRLLGVRTSKLTEKDEPFQLSLFDPSLKGSLSYSSPADPLPGTQKCGPSSPSAEKLAALDKTLDSIRQKYGKDAVVRGSLLKK